MKILLLPSIAFLASTAFAQTAPVPASYQSLYSELQGKLATFDSNISSQWNGTKFPTQFSAELLYANSNSGLLLLSAGTVAKYRAELNALKGLGVKAVVVKMGYPLLYQPFLQFNGDPADYAKIISFYQGVTNDVHAAGMKVIVESDAIFPGFFSSGSGLNVTGWYSSMTYNSLLTGYATVNATVATQIKPDYLNVGSEPDTQAKNTGFMQFYSPAGWAAAINVLTSMIPGSSGVKIGAGIGTWLTSDGQQFLQSILTSTNLDYIDLHVYPINTPAGSSLSIPQNTINLVAQAESAGKPVAFSEAWLLKTSDANYTQANASSDPATFSYDSYSFFAPLDQAFLQAMWKLANSKQLLFVSPFWSRYFWSYLDYNTVANLSAAAVTAAAEQAAAVALQNGQVTSTGQFYKSLLATPLASLLSAASLNIGPVAPASIVSLFGSCLAGTTGAAAVSITDSSGAVQPLTTVYTSATQINAILPANLANGVATVSITPTGGVAITGSLTVRPVAPGLFSGAASGSGVAAADTVTVHADGSVTNDVAFTCTTTGTCVGRPISVSTPGDTVYLMLFGTGLRNRTSLTNTSVIFGTQSVVPIYAGSQNGFAGLDQINVVIPPSLAGTGAVSLAVKVDGVSSNAVTIQIQ